jgi:ABC-type branched-subunit amino acid transport system ATPase component
MIEKISIKNFKSHADTTIELGRVTALVGPNGCGKTSLLKSILLCTLSATVRLDQLFAGENAPHHLVRYGQDFFAITIEGTDAQFAPWSVRLTLVKHSSQWNALVKWNWNHVASDIRQLKFDQAMHDVIAPEIINDLGYGVYFKAASRSLALPSYIEDLPPYVAFDGTGLATTVSYLMTYERDRFHNIEESLKEIVPTIRQIRVRPAKIPRQERRYLSVEKNQVPFDDYRELIGDELVFDTVSAKGIPAHAMSEGSLFTLGLLTILQDPNTPRVFLLDDVEQGLHPLAQRKLIQTLVKFAESNEQQLILTSHSGYIIDELGADDVWVMQTDSDGISYAQSLSRHHDAKRLLEVLTTGELADAVGEDWVLPQEPPGVSAGEAHA